ncbi:hypothetical protein BZG02_09675 [Labilibaculum filiforme]|uniref:Uncharacterized protein n=1 Tax=Labilibaculum filiforme TaxID=1940526 RepID=A0A2N3HYB5_9BACT|nr:hypothetical protein [Labilibaculum filiforme]PKQ63031.1 hypothetical protein BZG02_09675 [Labilibaculum filiforme]
MKQNKIILLILIFFNCFVSQAQNCTIKDVLEKTIIQDVKYSESKEDVNLESVLRYDQHEFIGFIGHKKKRLRINFTSIIIDDETKKLFFVKGATTVRNTNLRSFSGSFTVKNHFVFLEPIDDYAINKKGKYGFSILEYTLAEDPRLCFTGTFNGKILVCWYKDEEGNTTYCDLFDGYDGSRNYQFIGTWTSYKTNNSSICNWGQYRIPCSGDLDVGASEFMPNPKYNNVGWGDYVP